MEKPESSPTDEMQIYYKPPGASDYTTLTKALDYIFVKLAEIEKKVNDITSLYRD